MCMFNKLTGDNSAAEVGPDCAPSTTVPGKTHGLIKSCWKQNGQQACDTQGDVCVHLQGLDTRSGLFTVELQGLQEAI